MITRITAVLAAFTLTGAVLAVTAGPAQAVKACSTASICFYDYGASQSPAMIDHDGEDSSPNECHNMPSAYRNKTSYVQNRTNVQWYAFRSLDCGGPAGTLYANTNGSMSGVWDNSIKSYKRG